MLLLLILLIIIDVIIIDVIIIDVIIIDVIDIYPTQHRKAAFLPIGRTRVSANALSNVPGACNEHISNRDC